MRKIPLLFAISCAISSCNSPVSDASGRHKKAQAGAQSGGSDVKIISTSSVSEELAEQQAGLARNEDYNFKNSEYAKRVIRTSYTVHVKCTLGGQDYPLEVCIAERGYIKIRSDRKAVVINLVSLSYNNQHEIPYSIKQNVMSFDVDLPFNVTFVNDNKDFMAEVSVYDEIGNRLYEDMSADGIVMITQDSIPR